MTRPWAALAALGGAAVLGAGRRYRRWLAAQARRTSADSRIVDTALGPVEYDLRGAGPTVLHLHGGGVGHAGWHMLGHLVDAGYRLLTPDRPGYLGTPLADHGAPSAQADLFAATLDALGLDRVAVVGISAGGPAACAFALRHPDRTEALVLLSALTLRTPLSAEQRTSALGRLVLAPRAQDLASAVLHQAMTRAPALALRAYARTETTYDPRVARRYVRRILDDPAQRREVAELADAIVPATPRAAGVANDLRVQQTLADLPLDDVAAPTLIVHSRYDGDVPYRNATHAHARIPGSELVTVEQFGHLLWWGDAAVAAQLRARVEAFLRPRGVRGRGQAGTGGPGDQEGCGADG
jgi:pimeloyl-ACP methyl ester carboxylesterase